MQLFVIHFANYLIPPTGYVLLFACRKNRCKITKNSGVPSGCGGKINIQQQVCAGGVLSPSMFRQGVGA